MKVALPLFALLAVLAVCLLVLNRKTERYEGLRVGMTKNGRGVFATKAWKKGETIEICPLIVAPSDDWGDALNDYIFQHSDTESALALGQCSLYNHADKPNVTYTIDTTQNAMVLKAERDLEAGEQLFISYGSDWWRSRGLKPSKPAEH